MNKSFLTVGLWLLAGHGVYAGEVITDKNWIHYPEIPEGLCPSAREVPHGLSVDLRTRLLAL